MIETINLVTKVLKRINEIGYQHGQSNLYYRRDPN